MGTAIAWVLSHGWRELAGAAVMLGLFVAVLGWNAHERNIGDARCETKHSVADAEAQIVADKAAAPANAQIHANVDQITAPLPDYLHAYQDKSKASDCPDFPYVRKLKVKP